MTQKTMDEAILELEELAGEIKLKLHLAGLDAKDTWDKKLEPKLFEARAQAKNASSKAVHEAIEALREFASSIQP